MGILAIKGGTPVRTAPYPIWPEWGQEEIDQLTAVIKSGKWGSLNGTRTREFEEKYSAYQHAKHGICCNSGTTALKLAIMAAGIEPGSEIIVPAYTFIATASAVIEAGSVPIFVDISPDTYNIDPQMIAAAITPRTAAIMPVHFAGRPAEMDEILELAQKHHLKVIEDAAQGWGAEWRGKRVGAIGNVGCFSFQSSKNINCGEGGIIVTNDDLIAKMARSHNNCGRSEDGLWYEHFYFGGNTRITELQSAVLLAQMLRYERQTEIRYQNLSYLNEKLSTIPGIAIMRPDPRITGHACHLYIFRYQKDFFAGKPKAAFINAMRQEGIPTSPGYSIPLYKQPVFLKKAFGPAGQIIDLPIDYSQAFCAESERACYEEAIWFTQNILLGSRQDMDDIIAAIEKISSNAHELDI